MIFCISVMDKSIQIRLCQILIKGPKYIGELDNDIDKRTYKGGHNHSKTSY